MENEKIKMIAEIFNGKKIIVAFSGGVDSTLIAYLAKKYGKEAYAISIKSELISDDEIRDAENIAKEIGIQWNKIDLNILSDHQIKDNPPDRCYNCKKKIMQTLNQIKDLEGFDILVDGTNFDDSKEYRPGLQALKELNVISPLLIAKINKDEIRSISKQFNLSTWNKLSMPCLATRFPYFSPLTLEKLTLVRKSEKYLKKEFSINLLRVRYQYEQARIEIGLEEFKKILNVKTLKKINEKLKEFGFKKITLDLDGYKSGSFDMIEFKKN
ncbi:MAG: ATP-dependent sacrificial sulfur transferase LarE [Candidatus Helarchaeota archaeon]